MESEIETICNPPVVQKIRIQFAKTKLLRFLSHLEILNVITRALRRQQIPVAFSGGFHPHPKISFSSPISVGIISIAEFADVELYSEITPHQFMTLLNEALPDGLQILKACEIPQETPSLMSEIEFTKYRIQIPNAIAKGEKRLIQKIKSLMNSEEVWIDRIRRNKVKRVELRRLIKEIEFVGKNSKATTLDCILRDGSSGKGRPKEIVSHLLELDSSKKDKLLDLKIIKIDSYIPVDGELISPMKIDYKD